MELIRDGLYGEYIVEFFLKGKVESTELSLSKEDFRNKKHLLNWIDFLAKTEQWVPYNLFKDVFNIGEDVYDILGLSNVLEMKIRYESFRLTVEYINLDEE